LNDVSIVSNRNVGILDRIEMACCAVNMVAVFTMMLVVFYGVASRYIFNVAANWVSEVSEFMVVSLSFLALGYVQSKHKHLTITALIDKLGTNTKTMLRVITTLVSLTLFALLTWASLSFALKALHGDFVSDAANIPLFPFRLLVPVGGLLMCVRLVVDLVQDMGFLIGYGSLKPL
jgi:C4-dicarboxylate transporter DctQ subunit